MSPRWRDVVALTAGAVTPFAFAPFAWKFLVIATLAALMWSWMQATPGRSAWRGLLFGIGMFGVGVSWVYVSIHTYGMMPVPMAVLTVFLFILLLSLFPALAGFLQSYLNGEIQNKPFLALSVACVCWVMMEWLRGWVLTGFPWLSLGYSQVGWPLAGFSALFGVFGVSFTVVISAILLLIVVTRRGFSRWSAAAVFIILWCSGELLKQIEWVDEVGEPVSVALIQGNIALTTKWEPGQAQQTINNYISASTEQRDKDLIIWPESALPLYVDQLPSELWQYFTQHPANFLVGILERESGDTEAPYYNAVVAVSDEVQLYRKHHLVPFGEYFPMRPLLNWLLESFQVPMANFSSWQQIQTPLLVGGVSVGVSICYEDAFTHDIRQSLPTATLLVNVSEDAWFGDSLAPHQRLQMGQMRALETGRWMLRVSNSGGSAVINHQGDIVVTAPAFTQNTLTATAQPMQGSTPYVRFGNTPLLLMCLLLVGSAGLRRREKTAEKSG